MVRLSFVRPSRILKHMATCSTETESNYIQTIYEHERVVCFIE